MSTARALGVIYLVMASVFGVAIALHQHPEAEKTATAAGRATLYVTTNYIARPAAKAAVAGMRYADAHIARPGMRYAAAAVSAGASYADAHIARPGMRYAAAAVSAGARYADAHLVQPAAAAGLRQLKALFDAIDPPIRIARAERPRVTVEKEPPAPHVTLAPEVPEQLATLEPLPLPKIAAPAPAAPQVAMTLPPPLRPAVAEKPPVLGTSEPPRLVLLQPQPRPTLPRNDRLFTPPPSQEEPQRKEPAIDLTPGLIMTTPMPMGTETDIAPPGFISFCSRFLDQCVNSANNAPRVHLDMATQTMLKAVTRSVNRAIWPETDERHYGRGEYWDIPTDGYGNCKDYALTKRQKLIEAGLPERALRIAIVVTPRENRHVVLTVSTDHGDLVLDNLNDDVKPWTEIAYQWIERQDNTGGLGWETFPQGVALTEVARRQAAAAALVALASPPQTHPAQPALPRLALVQPLPQPPAVAPSPSSPPSPGELARVVERLRQSLTREMLANFELFLYVSKAEHGPWAQHMYVFAKADNGDLDLKYNWLVSTGREKAELNNAGTRLQTHTPAGYYQLDPGRLYRHYTSAEWGQPMPFAMFFNWVKDGRQTGLAIHAATGDDVALLGSRGSAGCIRLSPANAGTLFALIKSQYRGLAPRFAFDRRTGTMSNEGILLHDAKGHLQMADGYKVLIFVENYGGNDNVVAALF